MMVVGARRAAKFVAVLRELAECHALLAGWDYTLRPGGSCMDLCKWSLCAARRFVGHLKLASMASVDGWWLPVTACQCIVEVINLATLPTVGCATGVEMRAAVTAAPYSI